MPFDLSIEGVDGWQHQLVNLGRHRRGTRLQEGPRVQMQGPGPRSAPLFDGSRAPGAGGVLGLAQCRGIPAADTIRAPGCSDTDTVEGRAGRCCCQ